MSNTNENSAENIDKKYDETFFVNLAFVILGFALLTTLLLIIFKDNFNNYFDFTELASLGSFLGGIITAFLTISTILLVYATYSTQQKELSETRKQLEETVKQSQITNETMFQQQFETTFFNMINMHGSLINDLKLFGEEYRGREIFVKYYNDILDYYKSESIKSYLQRLLVRNRDSMEELSQEYMEFYHKSDYYYPDIDEYYGEEEFQELARDFIMGKRYDPTLMDDITVFTIFRLNYDEFENTCKKYEYLSFSIRMYKDFFDEPEFKETAIRMVDDKKYFPISHYLKSVKAIIRFVDQSTFNLYKKNEYLNIFFSQFTSHEIMIIYYFISFNIDEELKEYFVKYDNLVTKDFKLQDSFI